MNMLQSTLFAMFKERTGKTTYTPKPEASPRSLQTWQPSKVHKTRMEDYDRS